MLGIEERSCCAGVRERLKQHKRIAALRNVI
jgi:hypothetical protein